jgi:anti-anti-sigma factor
VASIVNRRATPSVAVVSLVGEHDLGDYESLKVAFARAGIQARNVVVDLARCTFIDSTVIAVMLQAQSVMASDGGRFALVLPAEPNAVTRTVELMALSSLFAVCSSLEAALESMPPAPAAATRPA